MESLHLSCTSLPLSSVRLMVPPLQLVSAAIWQTVQKRGLADYGMLEEFVTVVTDAIPELLTSSERAQLTVGLRARLILELCKHKGIADHYLLQPHLDRIHLLTDTHQANIADVTMSDSNIFSEFIQNLLKDPSKGKDIFQKGYPVEFFGQCDNALDNLMVLFLTRLEKSFPLYTFQEVAFMCAEVSSVLEDSVVSVSRREELRTLLKHQRNMRQKLVAGVIEEKATNCNDATLKENAPIMSETELDSEAAFLSPPRQHPEEIVDSRCGSGRTVNQVPDDLKGKNQKKKRKKTEVSVKSRPVRSNRGLKMRQYLMEEKRQIDDESGYINPPTNSCPEGSVSKGYKKGLQTSRGNKSSQIIPSLKTCSASKNSNKKSKGLEKSLVTHDSDNDSWSYYSDQESLGHSSGSWSYYSGDDPTIKSSKSRKRSDDLPSADKVKATSKVPRRVHCFICQEQLKTSIKTHMKTHFPNGEYSCPFCDTRFKLLRSLQLHLRRTCYEHNEQNLVPDPSQSLFKCDTCQKGFRYNLALLMHERTHNKLYCGVCRRVLRSPAQLERHKASHMPFHCIRCEESFTVYKHLLSHCRHLHKLRAPFQCIRCPKTFSKLQTLIKHEWKDTGDLPFQCTICESKFKCDNELESHQRVHSKEKPHLCAVCGKAFSLRCNLLRHLRLLHSESRDEKKHACSLCDKSFKEKGALVMHQRKKHLKELFRYPCPICGKMFSASSIGRHKLIHTGEKPFKCPVPECDRVYRSKPEVKRHVLISHSTDRPYKCEVCGKGFVLPCHLKSHSKIHSGVKPFVCHICGKAFLKLYSVERHKRLVHSSVAV